MFKPFRIRREDLSLLIWVKMAPFLCGRGSDTFDQERGNLRIYLASLNGREVWLVDKIIWWDGKEIQPYTIRNKGENECVTSEHMLLKAAAVVKKKL